MTTRKPLGTPKFKWMGRLTQEKYRDKVSETKHKYSSVSDYDEYCKKIKQYGGTPLSYGEWLYNVEKEFSRR